MGEDIPFFQCLHSVPHSLSRWDIREVNLIITCPKNAFILSQQRCKSVHSYSPAIFGVAQRRLLLDFHRRGPHHVGPRSEGERAVMSKLRPFGDQVSRVLCLQIDCLPPTQASQSLDLTKHVAKLPLFSHEAFPTHRPGQLSDC